MPHLTLTRVLLAVLVLVLALHALGLRLTATLVLAQPTLPPACTAHVSPTSALTVQGFLASAHPGAVLCLAPGTYTGSQNMLLVESGRGGTPDTPLMIRALIDGTVLVDGQFGQRPLDCNGSDVTFQGMNVKNGNDTVLVLRGTRCTAKRMVAWSDWDGMDNVIDLGGQGNVLEDVSAFGYGRKMVAAGARAGRSNNILRRIWAEFNGFSPAYQGQGNPTHAIEIGYDQDGLVLENALVRRNVLTSATEPYAPLVAFSTHDSWMGGVIGYLQPGDHYDTSELAFLYPEGGSHAGSGHVNTRVTLTQSVFVAPPSFSHVRGLFIQSGGGASANVVDSVLSIAPQAGSAQAQGWTFTNVKDVRSLAEVGGQSPWLLVPGICYRYHNRQLTSEPLWPWPMARRTSQALVQAGREPYDITTALEGLLGPIPAQCKRATPESPEPPDPPEPPSPGRHPTMQCTGTLAQVPGPIALQCIPETTARRR